MLKWLRNLFGSKQEKPDERLNYDPTNVQVKDLRKGAFLDYDLKTWEVKAQYEYDWGDRYFSFEFLLATVEDKMFLHYEEDDGELECTLTEKIRVSSIDADIPEEIRRNGVPPKEITHKGITFYRDEEGVARFRDVDTRTWEKVVSWSYYDEAEKHVLSIEQGGETEFEAAFGLVVDESEFSNIILP
jgi:hypothetical protein